MDGRVESPRGLAGLRPRRSVRTPENVTFEFELAGLGARGLAWGLDLVVMLLLTVALTAGVALFSALSPGLATAIFFVGLFLVQWWYSALAEYFFAGQTVGKKALRLRTLQSDGLRITFGQAVVRNLLRVVDLLPGTYMVGAIAMLMGEGLRRLGDLAAGTIVVRELRPPAPSEVVPASMRYNTFLEDPAVAQAVGRIAPPERDAMIALAVRREQLPIDVRHRLFRDLSGHLEDRLAIPRPAQLSEEKYVLNLLVVALSRGKAQAERS